MLWVDHVFESCKYSKYLEILQKLGSKRQTINSRNSDGKLEKI
jgi:hypothetical protein